MAQSLDLYIDQGSHFRATLPAVRTSGGQIVNLTGYTVECLMRRSYSTQYAVVITAEITNATGGIITLTLAPEETSGLQASVLHTSRWVYDVVLTGPDPDNIVTKVFEGMVIVNPSVTSKPNTILLTPYVPEDFGGI